MEKRVYYVRGQRVMTDSDLALIYGVETRVINQAVSRNKDRFPQHFMFRLRKKEYSNLKSQFVISSLESSAGKSRKKWGGRRKLPMVFTEHGAIMLASVLRSKAAIKASVIVIEAFVRFREILSRHRTLARKLEELEVKSDMHDRNIRQLFESIRRLMEAAPERKRLGYRFQNEE